MKVLLHVEDRPEEVDVAVQTTSRPLFAMLSAKVTEPSALTMQPTAPSGHVQLMVGGMVQQMSVPVAEKVEVPNGQHSTASVGAEQVMVGETPLMLTVDEQLP